MSPTARSNRIILGPSHSHFDPGHCPFHASSPGFSRFSRGDRLKPGLHTCQNENCCLFHESACLGRRFLLDEMDVQTKSPAQRRTVGHAIVTGLTLGLWLGMSLLAASPCLHHLLHHDSQNLGHHCVFTQFSKSPVMDDSAAATIPAPRQIARMGFAIAEFPFLSADLHGSFHSRAPPPYPLLQPVVG